MQEDTASKKSEDVDFPNTEKNFPAGAEKTLPENPELDSPESAPQREELREETSPPHGKKRFGGGKIFLFAVVVLAGAGGYLYFNNLVPPEIFRDIFPIQNPDELSAPSKISATDAPAVPVAPAELSAPPEPSASVTETSPTPPTVAEEDIAPEVADDPAAEFVAEKVSETSVIIPEHPTATPAEHTSRDEPAELPAAAVERNESVRAYLDFIESSVQKLGEWVKEGFDLGWDYVTEKRG